MKKVPELQAVVHDHAQQIIEFWFASSIDDTEVYLNGYNLFHDDRPSGIGGGVLQYFTYIFHCQLSHVRNYLM